MRNIFEVIEDSVYNVRAHGILGGAVVSVLDVVDDVVWDVNEKVEDFLDDPVRCLVEDFVENKVDDILFPKHPGDPQA